MIVAETSYELTDPTIDSQIVKLKAAGADLLYDASTPKFAAQAIKKVADLGWKPVHILDINASPVSATLKPAGLDISKDIISTNYGKDPGDPQWKDDAGIKAYFAFMDKYYPEGDKLNTVNTYGYSTAELLVKILQQCGDDLTRENIMKQAANLKNVTGSLSLPGMVTNTSPTDYRINKHAPPRFKTEAVGVTHDADGFCFEPRDVPARAPVHHFTADTRCGFFLSKRNLIPETRLLDTLHCNMASATIVAAMTSAGETKPRQDHRLNHKHMRNAAL